jgi:hypothetical protein
MRRGQAIESAFLPYDDNQAAGAVGAPLRQSCHVPKRYPVFPLETGEDT